VRQPKLTHQKRNPRLSPNKFQAIIRIFHHTKITCGDLRFYQINVIIFVCEKKASFTLFEKEKNIPIIAYEICLASSL